VPDTANGSLERLSSVARSYAAGLSTGQLACTRGTSGENESNCIGMQIADDGLVNIIGVNYHLN